MECVRQHMRPLPCSSLIPHIYTGGSFAENFYGMKRRRRPGVSSERAQAAADLFSDHQKLRKRELRWSLFFLVSVLAACSVGISALTTVSLPQITVPYLRTKGDDLFDQLGGNVQGGDLFADQDHHSGQSDEVRFPWSGQPVRRMC